MSIELDKNGILTVGWEPEPEQHGSPTQRIVYAHHDLSRNEAILLAKQLLDYGCKHLKP